MNDYFSTVRQGLGDAVERQAHLRWYSRLWRAPRARPLVVVVATLVIATPAVAAVSGWFSPGKPNPPGPVSPVTLYGVVKPGHSRLLQLRVADEQGGPPWGLRVVRTTRGDTCVQIGRVEAGQLGSLGIDDAWHNDREFHAISPDARADIHCGSTDAVGHGFLNGAIDGETASVDLGGDWQSAIKIGGCQLSGFGGGSSRPDCPAGANRIIFYGLLGPDAVSITYRNPGGRLSTQRLLRGVGAYLLVFPYNAKTCAEYTHSWDSSHSCNTSTEGGGPTPPVPGAVVKVTYTDGRSCNLSGPSPRLVSRYRAFTRKAARELLGSDYRKREHRPISAKLRAEFERLLVQFAAGQHLTVTQLNHELGPIAPQCPAVGWVAPKEPKITTADVATPIHIKTLPTGSYGCPNKLKLPDACSGLGGLATREVPVEWSFKARRAVTNSRSWYEYSVRDPGGRDCDEQGAGSSYSTFHNIRAGQLLRFSQFFAAGCPGTYEITVGYMPYASPANPDNGGGADPGHDGTILVGSASFTIH
jgi:hypothetical protein